VLVAEREVDPVLLDGDPDALEQLFLNLLINAAEALKKGGTATVRVTPDPREVVIQLRDDGPGMSPEVRKRAFEPLFSTRKEGTGLGLAIARQIARAHGGEIWIESEVESGTTVEVRLPRTISRLPPGPGSDPSGGAGSGL
jgi:signal transduction histidine kinase